MTGKVAVILGSDSDLPVAEKIFTELRAFDIPFEAHIMSAHRTPDRAAAFAKEAQESGFSVIIAVAGMAAHLAGVLAAQTILPVIGVPCYGGASGGLDALLSTVQMPAGIPVATVALGGGANAALLAAEMLAITDTRIATLLWKRKTEMVATIEQKEQALQDKILEYGRK
jgi:5-(carboxyamino)imidazole ribonucleotide mutase